MNYCYYAARNIVSWSISDHTLLEENLNEFIANSMEVGQFGCLAVYTEIVDYVAHLP